MVTGTATATALTIDTPRALVPLLAPSRYKAIYGGRGGLKSNFFAGLLVEECVSHRPLSGVCVREIQKSLEHSVKRLIENKITSMGLRPYFRILDTHIETPGGGVLIFNGMQNHTADSIKSLEGFDRVWVEEAQSLSERSLTLLRPTIRKKGSELWFSWNPEHPSDPVDVFFRGQTPPPDSIIVRTSYRDNPWFENTALRQEMEWDRARDVERYSYVWLGNYKSHAQSRVFKNWRIAEFDTPKDVFHRQGGDWGYSVDPTVLVRMHSPAPQKLYIDYEVYQVGCEIDHTPDLFDRLVCGCDPPTLPCRTPELHGNARIWPTIADSARPETISYLKRHGYPLITPAIKGPNSVLEGVVFLQSYDIVIHPRCTHTADEFLTYSFKVDPLTEKVTNVLEDKKNHVIDSVRYGTEPMRHAAKKRRPVLYG